MESRALCVALVGLVAARDVVTFLTWASEPKLEERHRLGFGVMAFMSLLSGMLFLSYRRVWKDAH